MKTVAELQKQCELELKKLSKIKKIIPKLRHYSERQWGGYLTPTEIISLVEYGVRPSSEKDLDRAKTNKKNGISNPTWFYFGVDDNFTL